MTVGLALACGEVPWERNILEAIAQHPALAVAKRYVDVGTLISDAKSGALAPVLLMTPAVRGFDIKPVLAIAATGVHLVIVLDTVRPTWLEGSGLDCRERSDLHLPSLLEEFERCATRDDRTVDEPAGRLTVFAGVSGGVGVTSLAWIQSLRQPSALLVDGHIALPLLGFLSGADAAAATLPEALRALETQPELTLAGQGVGGRVLTLPLGGMSELGEREAGMLVDAAAVEFSDTLIDAGPVHSSHFADALLDRAQGLVLVATAAPSGVLRLPGALESVRRDDLEITLVINRFRESAAGSRHARTAIRGLVERSCGITPVFVDDDAAGFDAAWLDGDWRGPLSCVRLFS